MSEFFNSMQQKSTGSNSGSRSRPPLQANIALQITGHDLSVPNGGVVHGIARSPEWLAGEQISIRLTNQDESVGTFRARYTEAENAKFFKTRPTVAQLMGGFKVGRNEIEPMKVGGFLMMYGATKDLAATTEGQPTVWKAQYPENYGNDASRDVIHGAVRVSLDPGNEAAGKNARASVDVLFTGQATVLRSIEDLRNFFDDHMEGQKNGVDQSANSVLRVVSRDGATKSLWTYSSRNTVEVPPAVDGDEPRKYSVSASAEQTWKDGVEEGKHAKGMLKVIAVALGAQGLVLEDAQAAIAKGLALDLQNDEIFIEAIPGRRIPIVGSSLDDLMTEGTKLASQANKCLVAVEGRDNKIPGFVKMTVGTMTSTPRGGGNLPDTTIVTKFAADDFAKARTLDYLSTAIYTPQFTQAREAEQKQDAEKASQAGGVETARHQDSAPEQQDDAQNYAKPAEASSPTM